jgi:hypothetical protein
MSEPKWVRLVERPKATGRKTSMWDVVTKDAQPFTLGVISWYGPWRCYAFTPTLDGPTVFEKTCLRDLAAFMEEQMQLRKAAR